MPSPLVKPYPDFPLTPHKRGYWVKVINGKQYLFGTRWCSPEEALRDYVLKKQEIMDGFKAQPDPDEYTLREGLIMFLESRKQRVACGEITQRSYDDYYRECVHIRDTLGASLKLVSIRQSHFEKLRSTYKGSPSTISNRVGRAKVAFAYMYKSGLVSREFVYGDGFRRPSAKQHRLHRHERPKKLFTPQQVNLLIEHAKPQMKAMIWLGLFAGFGNTDCGTVEQKHFRCEWVEYHRPKTGVPRRAWLPQGAVDAVSAVEWPLRTKYGNPWSQDRATNPISSEFRKLARSLGVSLGFYSLRHTCATIGGNSMDQAAVNYVMGHVLPGMVQTYNEGISDDRLLSVGKAILEWLSAPHSTGNDLQETGFS